MTKSGLIALVIACAGAAAQTLTPWNLVVGGDLSTSSSEVDGSALIGGSLLGGTSNYAVQGVTAPNGAALAIGGTLASGVTVNLNNSGDLRIASAANKIGTANLNGGVTVEDSLVAVRAAAILQRARNVGSHLATLSATGTVDGAGNMSSASTHSLDGLQVAVYELSQTMFDSGLGQLSLNMGTADTVVINYTTTNGIADLTAPPNIIGGFSQANSSRIIWNFVDASQITVGNSFSGALLAPDAALSVTSGGINGTVIVDSITAQDAEIRLNLYTGYVPAPGTAGLVLGVSGLLALRRRR